MTRHPLFGCFASVLALLLSWSSSLAQNTAAPRAMGAWDTGKAAGEALSAAVVAQKEGWQQLASGAEPANFQGDVAISNGRLLVIARRMGSGIELYSLGLGAPVLRGRLMLAGDGPNQRVVLAENGRSAAGLDVTSAGGSLRFGLKKGDHFVEVRSVAGKAPLQVECPGRFAVLPDFFADDILIDARKLPSERVELPSENFLLQFAGDSDALVMSVFENRNQDVCVNLAGKGDTRTIRGAEIDFGKLGSKIWVAVLEGPGMWHAFDVDRGAAGKVRPLDWKMPFVAQWRVDFTRRDGLTDSWDMLLPDRQGGYIKPSWLAQDGSISAATRTKTGEIDRDAYKPGGPASDRLGPDRQRWTTVLGRVSYPCWSDEAGRGFLQPLQHRRLVHDGPVLIYPSTRLAHTPIATYTPVDIVRNTLGIGPCQHLLDVEGQKQEHVGRATCHVRTLLNEVYGGGLQLAKRREIENYLGDALDFVTHIRNRIQAYVAFGKDLRRYLAEQRAAHPEWKEALEELDALAREIDERVGPREAAILRQPALQEIAGQVVARKEDLTAPALAAQLNRRFVALGLLDYTAADWQAKIKSEYTDPLTTIGGQQDEMVGECRWVVKALRQKAGILLASDPRLAPLAAEIRTRTQKMLRGGAAYEGARH